MKKEKQKITRHVYIILWSDSAKALRRESEYSSTPILQIVCSNTPCF